MLSVSHRSGLETIQTALFLQQRNHSENRDNRSGGQKNIGEIGNFKEQDSFLLPDFAPERKIPAGHRSSPCSGGRLVPPSSRPVHAAVLSAGHRQYVLPCRCQGTGIPRGLPAAVPTASSSPDLTHHRVPHSCFPSTLPDRGRCRTTDRWALRTHRVSRCGRSSENCMQGHIPPH